MTKKVWTEPTHRFDRMCEHMTVAAKPDTYVQTDGSRGNLDLEKDGSQHRRFHALYEDLQN